ncbi:SGNH/GDSL hydrolase family protein [Undibacterium sp. Ren11W]|uniref:SGNH/GDSL hydrolase family protein n=1 Tax=Undibacterium sp. Ren11W TaxID=3413045 RepID=UPI003BF1C428
MARMKRRLRRVFSLALVSLILGCAYNGPRVDAMLPDRQSAWLDHEVGDSASGGIEHLVVFGDSLSDPGNLNRNSFGLLVPDKIFYHGRFSNGPIWADYVEYALHWKLDNFAVGGARTRPGAFPENLVVTSLPEQIDKNTRYLQTLDTKKTLISIWIGPNNYLRNGDQYQEASGKPKMTLLTLAVEQTIAEIESEIYKMQKLGFNRISIGTMPELGGINRDPKGAAAATDETLFMATRLHNQKLSQMLERLGAKNAELKLIKYQAYDINKATYDNPQAYGFSVLNAPCFVGSVKGQFYGKQEFCNDPMGYKFWEYIHPNTRMQCYYATQFLNDIAAGGLIDGYSQKHALDRCLAIKNKQG